MEKEVGVRVTKIEGMDHRNIGEFKEGFIYSQPKIGESLWVRISDNRWFITSTIISIIDLHTFKTVNSTYTIEYILKCPDFMHYHYKSMVAYKFCPECGKKLT